LGTRKDEKNLNNIQVTNMGFLDLTQATFCCKNL